MTITIKAETHIRLATAQRAARRKSDAQDRERESTEGGTQRVMASMIPLVAQELEDRLANLRKGKRALAIPFLQRLGDMRLAAFLTCRTIFDSMSTGSALSGLGLKLGSRVEDETRFQEWRREAPGLFRSIEERLAKEKHGSDYRYRHRVLVHAFNRSGSVTPWEDWGNRARLALGLFLLDAFTQATGLVEKVRVPARKRGHSRMLIMPSTECLQLIAEQDERMMEMYPFYLPLDEKPKPWTNLTDGGYWTYQCDLVKTRDRRRRRALEVARTHMPKVFTALNAVQDTAWQINADVLATAEQLWQHRYTVAGMPGREPLPEPMRPEAISKTIPLKELPEVQAQELREWKGRRTQWFAEENERKIKLLAARQIIEVGKLFQGHEAIYFPHQLDWRGRAYPIPLFLQPQGSDLAKGLLRFAKGKKLGKAGLRWLAIHGANSWAHDALDKSPFEERIGWVQEHSDEIALVADDPVSNLWWAGAKAPWQFLAFCFEWAGARCGGDEEYVSHLPVGMDGSCNGLQHYSAMLRDLAGGSATNLVPSEKPRDIYAQVAEVVQRKVSDESASSPLGRQWLQSGLLDRDAVKHQVMTLPYGVTRPGMGLQLKKFLKKLRVGGKVLPFEDGTGWAAAEYLTPHIWDSISEVVVGALEGMSFLRACARIVAKADRGLQWTTPVGFPVVQKYVEMRKHEIKSTLLGGVRVRFREKGTKLDRRKQESSVAPNFIHSLDAAHLVMTVSEMPAGTSFAMVHDSFGTHAADSELLASTLRATFVSLYLERDPLAEFRADCQRLVPEGRLPRLPEKGSLELPQVLRSPYFFA